MGWIRISHKPAKSLHELAAHVEVESQKEATPEAEEVESVKPSNEKDVYPIQPKRVSDKDLPLIGADEVRKQDGKNGRRLCTLPYLPNHCPTCTCGVRRTDDCAGVVVDDLVIDCTSYVLRHPGGQQIIRGFGGQNASWQWWSFHNRKVWDDTASHLRVGRTEGIKNRHEKPKAFVGLRKFGYQDD